MFLLSIFCYLRVIILLVHLHKLVVAVVANIVENHMHLVLNLIEVNLAIAVADRIQLVAVEDKMEPVVADKMETVVADSNIVVVEMDC